MKLITSMVAFISLMSPLHAEEGETLSPTPSSFEEEVKCADQFDQKQTDLMSHLLLTPSQMPLWQEWSDRLMSAHRIKKSSHMKEKEWRQLPAPTRQEKWMLNVQEHLKFMQLSLPALTALYAALSVDQKKVFDAEVPFKYYNCCMIGSD